MNSDPEIGQRWRMKTPADQDTVEETKVSEMTDAEIANLRTGIDRALNIEGYDDAERVKQIEEIAKQNARLYLSLSKTECELANAEEVILRMVMAHLSTADDDSGLLLRLERGVERLASENARLRAKQEETK